MIVIFDPETRLILETTCAYNGIGELKQQFRDQGKSFTEVEGLPAEFDRCWVNEDLEVLEADDLEGELAVVRLTEHGPLPPVQGLSVPVNQEPPEGTPLQSGVYNIRVHAVGYVPRFYHVIVRTRQDDLQDLLAWAANRRWELMQAGTDWRGHRLSTDDVGQSRLTSSIVATQYVEDWSTIWQFPLDGSSARITKVELIDIARTAQAFVNKLFVAFDEIATKVRSGDITTTDEIEARFDEALSGVDKGIALTGG